MSQQLISRSADLRRLRDEGYEVAVVGGHLTVGHVPYVDAARQVRYGTLISELTLAGDVTIKPSTHVVTFAGDMPCDHLGSPLTKIVNGEGGPVVSPDLAARYTFSSKPQPPHEYADYYAKMTTYVAILASHAQVLDPSATAQTFRPVTDESGDTVFVYLDTASSRAGIADFTARLAAPRVAIVGLGGTGAYVLDYVAKTPIGEIHLFDGDRFLQHNAFRAPGAATLEQLAATPFKVDYMASTYAAMRRGIVPHPYVVDEGTVAELTPMSFVFICVDDGPAKKVIIDHLEEAGIGFIDVGIGLYEVDGRIAGAARTTLSAGPEPSRRAARERISLAATGEDLYGRNIQVAELNAHNAATAVIKWKKLMGFYNDLGEEFHSVYTIDTNELLNETRS
jgi:hypothetical protein